MDPIVVVFLAVNAVLLLSLPRRWAPLPLLIAACYMTRAQTIELGVASFTVVRVLIAVGAVRAIVRGERIRGGLNGLDWLMIAWGIWMVGSVVFHPYPNSPFVLRMRDLYEAWGLYFLFRVFCQTREDVRHLAGMLAVVLLPIGLSMTMEKSSGTNPFARFGGVGTFSTMRDGVIRAQGPFAHAILAGSIGGVCLPLIVALWRDRRRVCVIGCVACMAMVLASGSSGPILAAGSSIVVLCLWPWHTRMRVVRWTSVVVYLALELLMSRPAYFVITYVDLTGSSTSWYRAELIRAAIVHFSEWALVGTDYTRHWMPTGVYLDPTQADITNQYIGNGVLGGLLLMLLFIALFVKAFWQVGRAIRLPIESKDRFFAWAVGAALFSHASTCLSVSYYDHSIIFLYMTFAASSAILFSDAATPSAVTVTPSRAQALPNVNVKFRGPVRNPAYK